MLRRLSHKLDRSPVEILAIRFFLSQYPGMMLIERWISTPLWALVLCLSSSASAFWMYFSKIRGVPNLLPSSLTPNILRNNRGGLLTPISTALLFRRILEQGRDKRLGTPLVIWFLAESVQSITNKFSVVGMCVCVWKICTPSQEASRSRIRSVGSAWRSERIWVVLWLFTNTYSIAKHAGNVFFGFPTCVLSRKNILKHKKTFLKNH